MEIKQDTKSSVSSIIRINNGLHELLSFIIYFIAVSQSFGFIFFSESVGLFSFYTEAEIEKLRVFDSHFENPRWQPSRMMSSLL